MGTRGPPPTPTKILAMRGSWRAGRNPAEPRPEPGRPRCPKWLDTDAKAAWRRLVPQLDRMGVVTRIYLDKDESGRVKGVRPYPQARMAAQLSEQLLRFENHFGMTPSARTRLSVPAGEAPQDDQDKRRFLKLG